MMNFPPVYCFRHAGKGGQNPGGGSYRSKGFSKLCGQVDFCWPTFEGGFRTLVIVLAEAGVRNSIYIWGEEAM